MRVPTRNITRSPPPRAMTRGEAFPSKPGTLFGIDVRTALSLAVLAGSAYFVFSYDPIKSMDFGYREPKLPKPDPAPKPEPKRPKPTPPVKRASAKKIFDEDDLEDNEDEYNDSDGLDEDEEDLGEDGDEEDDD